MNKKTYEDIRSCICEYRICATWKCPMRINGVCMYWRIPEQDLFVMFVQLMRNKDFCKHVEENGFGGLFKYVRTEYL